MKRFLICSLTVLLFAIAGCSKRNAEETEENRDIPVFSDYYLAGISFGGPSFGDHVAEAEGLAVICTDGSVRVYLPETDGEYVLSDYVLQDIYELSEEQYADIEKLIDREKLSATEVSKGEVTDGAFYGLSFYDDEMNPIGYYGGYEPPESEEEFWSIYYEVRDLASIGKAETIRDKWIYETLLGVYGDEFPVAAGVYSSQEYVIIGESNLWILSDEDAMDDDWYCDYAVTDLDGDGYLEICKCMTYNNGPVTRLKFYEVTENGRMTEIDTGFLDDYPDLTVDHYTDPIRVGRDDNGNLLYYVCNFVSNGIEGAEHQYGVMYLEDNVLHFDEIPEDDLKETDETVNLGWFSEVNLANVYISYNSFVKQA